MAHPTFAERLRASRKKRGLRQAEVADSLGVSVQAVSLWETGQTSASHNRMVLLGELLGVDWDWLGYGAELDDPTTPVTLNEELSGDYQKGPMCDRSEIARWVENFPDLTDEIDEALGFDNDDYERDIVREYFEPRFPPSGIIFAIGVRTKSMEPSFVRGDVMLCDTAIKPVPGDHVVVYIGINKSVIFRKYKQRQNLNGDIIQELIPENEDFPVITFKAENGDKIVGTMVEHRRYRLRKGEELTAYWQTVRKAYSSET